MQVTEEEEFPVRIAKQEIAMSQQYNVDMNCVM